MRVWLALLVALPLLTIGSGSGANAGTSDPPRNGLIAAGGGDGIYLIDAQRMTSRKLPGTNRLGEPTWSPDGGLLAVEGYDENGSNVYTIRPDGSDRQLVLQNAWSPSWSPDGKRLVVLRDGCLAPYACESEFDASSVLVTVSVDGSDAQRLTFGDGDDSAELSGPVWSPNGKWIAFVRGEAVKLVSAKGGDGGVRTIARSGWNLAWSPDSSQLAFDTVEKATDYRQQIVAFDLATGKRATLLSGPRPVSGLAWSPDGKQLAFLSSRPMPKSSGGCGGEMPLDLWMMSAGGSNPHRVAKGSYGQPSWGAFQPAVPPPS